MLYAFCRDYIERPLFFGQVLHKEIPNLKDIQICPYKAQSLFVTFQPHVQTLYTLEYGLEISGCGDRIHEQMVCYYQVQWACGTTLTRHHNLTDYHGQKDFKVEPIPGIDLNSLKAIIEGLNYFIEWSTKKARIFYLEEQLVLEGTLQDMLNEPTNSQKIQYGINLGQEFQKIFCAHKYQAMLYLSEGYQSLRSSPFLEPALLSKASEFLKAYSEFFLQLTRVLEASEADLYHVVVYLQNLKNLADYLHQELVAYPAYSICQASLNASKQYILERWCKIIGKKQIRVEALKKEDEGLSSFKEQWNLYFPTLVQQYRTFLKESLMRKSSIPHDNLTLFVEIYKFYQTRPGIFVHFYKEVIELMTLYPITSPQDVYLGLSMMSIALPLMNRYKLLNTSDQHTIKSLYKKWQHHVEQREIFDSIESLEELEVIFYKITASKRHYSSMMRFPAFKTSQDYVTQSRQDVQNLKELSSYYQVLLSAIHYSCRKYGLEAEFARVITAELESFLRSYLTGLIQRELEDFVRPRTDCPLKNIYIDLDFSTTLRKNFNESLAMYQFLLESDVENKALFLEKVLLSAALNIFFNTPVLFEGSWRNVLGILNNLQPEQLACNESLSSLRSLIFAFQEPRSLSQDVFLAQLATGLKRELLDPIFVPPLSLAQTKVLTFSLPQSTESTACAAATSSRKKAKIA